jgi:hypothetical protein
MRTWGTLVASLLLTLTLGAACGGDDSDDAYSAKYICHQFVKDDLKSPRSAHFSNETATEDKATKEWTVSGDVDADNSFGASIRNTYTCDATYEGNGEYRGHADLGDEGDDDGF